MSTTYATQRSVIKDSIRRSVGAENRLNRYETYRIYYRQRIAASVNPRRACRLPTHWRLARNRPIIPTQGAIMPTRTPATWGRTTIPAERLDSLRGSSPGRARVSLGAYRHRVV